MVDLTAPEIQVILWHFHIVDAAYGQEAPEGSTVDTVRQKLMDELAKPECNGQRGMSLA